MLFLFDALCTLICDLKIVIDFIGKSAPTPQIVRVINYLRLELVSKRSVAVWLQNLMTAMTVI